MDMALVLVLVLLSISQVSIASSRVLVGDEVPGQVNLPPESSPPKDPTRKVDEPSLASHTNEPSNQSELAHPVSDKKETQEQTLNPKQENHTVLAPSGSQETEKSANISEAGGGAETGTAGTEAEKGANKEGNITKIEELCDMETETCHDKENWIACLQHPANDSKEIFLVVENKGVGDISFDVKSTTSLILDTRKIDLGKHGYRKVKILISDSNHAANVTINAGKGDCILHVKLATAYFDWQKPFQQFASYATQLTPIYGAYLLLFTTVISLITWACCKFVRGRRRSDSGPTYQQLEMGGVQDPQSNSANADVTDSADGWENGWDDNWDDEEAAVGKPVAASGVSGNGLSSRSNNNSSSKDGWEVDWDD